MFRRGSPTRFPAWTLWGLAICGAVYGGYAFQKRQLAGYMLLKNRYAFFDFSEPRIAFFLDYLAILLLFALIGYALFKTASRKVRKREET